MTRAPSECVWVCVWGLAQVFGHAWHRATWLYFGILFFFQCFSHSHILHTLKNELIFTYSWAHPNTPRVNSPTTARLQKTETTAMSLQTAVFLAFPSQSEPIHQPNFCTFSTEYTLSEWMKQHVSLLCTHTHTKQTPHLTGVKVHALYDEEPGSLWVIIPASLCSHWSIFIPHPEHTHTQWCAMPLHWFHWFHCRDTLISIPTSDWNKDSKGTLTNQFDCDKVVKQAPLVKWSSKTWRISI